jgi:hypothetical protein
VRDICISDRRIHMTGEFQATDITEPRKFSGQITVRMPCRLHRELAAAARTEGVSVNHFVCVVIALAVGAHQHGAAPVKSTEMTGDEAFEQFWRERLA